MLFQEAIEENSFFAANSGISVGNITDGFRVSDKVIEGNYGTGYQEHFYLEPISGLVMPTSENEEMHIYVTSQNLAGIQVSLSLILCYNDK